MEKHIQVAGFLGIVGKLLGSAVELFGFWTSQFRHLWRNVYACVSFNESSSVISRQRGGGAGRQAKLYFIASHKYTTFEAFQ